MLLTSVGLIAYPEVIERDLRENSQKVLELNAISFSDPRLHTQYGYSLTGCTVIMWLAVAFLLFARAIKSNSSIKAAVASRDIR